MNESIYRGTITMQDFVDQVIPNLSPEQLKEIIAFCQLELNRKNKLN